MKEIDKEKLRYENKRLAMEQREYLKELEKKNTTLKRNNTRLKNDLEYYLNILDGKETGGIER